MLTDSDARRLWLRGFLILSLLGLSGLAEAHHQIEVVSFPDCAAATLDVANKTGATLWVTIEIGYRCWEGVNCDRDAGFQESSLIPITKNKTQAFRFDTSQGATPGLGLQLPGCSGGPCDYTVFVRARAAAVAAGFPPVDIDTDYCTTSSPGIPSSVVAEEITSDLLIENEIDLGHIGPGTCISISETEFGLVNRSHANTYRGVANGKFGCLKNPADSTSICTANDYCDSGGPVTTGMNNNFVGFELPRPGGDAPRNCDEWSVRVDPVRAITLIANCCDCALAILQCGRSIVTEAKLAGEGIFRRVVPPIWSLVSMDREPETVTGSALSCDAFRFSQAPHQGAAPAAACILLDTDLDGELNDCDLFQPSGFLATGGSPLTATNPDPSRRPSTMKFCPPLESTCPEVPVTAPGTPPYSPITALSPVGLPGPASVTVNYSSGSPLTLGFPAPNDTALFRQLLQVSNTGETRVMGFDTRGENRVLDIDPSDLDVDLLDVGFSPWSGEYLKEGALAEVDTKYFVVGEFDNGTSTEGRLYGFDPLLNQPVDLDADEENGDTPLTLPGPARALATLDNRYLFLPYDITDNEWAIEVVDLAPLFGSTPAPPLQIGALARTPGRALDIRVAEVGASTYAYVVFEDLGCRPSLGEEPGFGDDPLHPRPRPRDDGGGSGPDWTRTVEVAVVDVTPPTIPGSILGYTAIGSRVVSCDLPVLSEAGMDFTAAGDRLLVVSPDENVVRSMNTATFALDLAFSVGSFPTDVEVELVDGVEQGFVSNQDDDSVSIFSLANPGAVTTVPLDLDGIPNLMASALAVTSDGTRLYVACSGGNKVVPVDPATGGLGLPIPTGASPRRLVVQRSPV